MQAQSNERQEGALGNTETLPSTIEEPTDRSEAESESGSNRNEETRHQEQEALIDGSGSSLLPDDDSDQQQRELQDKFPEKRQIPPVRAGIMILLTVSEPNSTAIC